MISILTRFGERTRVLAIRLLQRMGLKEDSFLIVPAVLIGILTAAAAVGFHELIIRIRNFFYHSLAPETLYGAGLPLLVLFPALGGLVVGIVSRYIARAREGHGIIDVIESVVKTSGFVRPGVALEKMFTSAVTIGTGGSTGAEGPIVQIGAALASGVGIFFRLARQHMPILIGCGSAAGISAIFNAPIGGVLFTLEVILQDFSIRTFTPLVVASVIANVTTRAIFAQIGNESFTAIFAMPAQYGEGSQLIGWPQVPVFVVLGLLCGLAGVALTRMMFTFENRFARLEKLGALRPALGGAAVGIMGVVYIMVFGQMLLGQPKPFKFTQYPMPAFFGDGYGVIQTLLDPGFYVHWDVYRILMLLAFLCAMKILATCLTLASGGSGGIIAPSLFMGATAGGFLGTVVRWTGWFESSAPETYALIGMGAVLAAVVHAPLASILILFEITRDYRVTVPAMLATVVATGVARLIFPDSIYTHSLRMRGIRTGAGAELNVLRRISVEQVELLPATVLSDSDPAQRALDLVAQLGSVNFVVTDKNGAYRGMVMSDEMHLAIIQRDAVNAMIVEELMRTDIPLIKSTDDLATVFDMFARLELSHLPVCLAYKPDKIIGLMSRAALMRVYQEQLARS